jgi:hypothetical protein
METEPVDLKNLLKVFPELLGSDVIFEKEIYAHFGLLYMGFALLETSLINVATVQLAIIELRKSKVRTQVQWKEAHERAFDHCTKQTFGNLMRSVTKIREFTTLTAQLKEVKQVRDYFSHHFFRRESAHMGDKELALNLLSDIYQARQMVDNVENETHPRTLSYFGRLGLPIPTFEHTESATAKIRYAAKTEFRTGQLPHGIERWTKRGSED